MKPNLACAFTGATSFRFRAGGGPGTLTSLASFQFGNAQLRGHSDGCLFQSNFEIVTQVSAALGHRPARTRARSGAKHVAKSEQVAENVLDIAKARRAPRRTRGARYSRMAKPIIAAALFNFSMSSGLRAPARTSRAPAFAKANASVRPRPRLAPVIRTRRPVISIVIRACRRSLFKRRWIFTMAILMMSAAEPWISMLMASRSG